MFGFVFKSGMYYMIWNKFKSQFITLIISIVLIALIFSIYDDLYKVVKVSNKDSLVELLLLKWFIVSLIFGFNWYEFKKISSSQDDKYSSDSYKEDIDKEPSIKNELKSKQHQNILNKKKLKTKTDVILQKYL